MPTLSAFERPFLDVGERGRLEAALDRHLQGAVEPDPAAVYGAFHAARCRAGQEPALPSPGPPEHQRAAR